MHRPLHRTGTDVVHTDWFLNAHLRQFGQLHRSPTAVIGGAIRQSPECADCAARSLARDIASVTLAVRLVRADEIHRSSHDLCLVTSSPTGTAALDNIFQASKFVWNAGSDDAEAIDEMMLSRRADVPAAEAKKADGANMVALRIPKPPLLTGSKAWIH